MKNSAIFFFLIFPLFCFSQRPNVQFFGENDLYTPAASLLDDNVYISASSHLKKEGGYFFKKNFVSGFKDSVSVTDLGEPYVYGFIYAGTYNDHLLWLGSYDSAGTGFYNILGPAIVLTDTNFNVIDRFVLHKPNWRITALVVEGNTLVASIDSNFFLSSSRAAVFDLTNYRLDLVLDTPLTALGSYVRSIVIKDSAAYFFHGQRACHILDLQNFSIQSEVIIFPTNLLNSKFAFYLSTKVLKPDSIIKANGMNFWFSIMDSDLNLLDTFSFPSQNYQILFLNNCDAVVDGHYYFGGSYPPYNFFNGPAIETPFKICKLSGKQIAWERIIQEDSVYKELRYLMGTSAQDQLVALYLNYDMRVAQPKLSVALMIMDTSGAVLSTQTLWEPPQSTISLYPNPAGEWFVIDMESRQPVDLIFHNANGQVVKTQKHVQPGTRVPIADLAKGTYMVTIALHGSAEPPVVQRLVVR